MRKLSPALAVTLLLAPTGLWAETPDGQTPSEETVCDTQTGAAYGLCTAYCEAMDCDSDSPHASANACSRVRANFERITGQPLPCEATCPCAETIPLFRDFVNGAVATAVCQESASFITLVSPGNEFVILNLSSPASCRAGSEPPVAITAAEAFVCRELLRLTASSQGVACVSPE